MTQPADVSNLPENPAELQTLEHLRHFIHVTLCRRENLLEYQFPMTELEIRQNGRRCGIQFVLHGPRSVRLSALWAETVNEILLYDATGHRYNRIHLSQPICTAATA
ncbi:MAG: hypothetical protein ACPGXX_21185 [Planctomycetaceae bacterium]